MSIRILGGRAKGRSLTVPDSARPSGARLRKSLFDLLLHRLPPEGTQPVRFTDLHGGSGAIGLEAASRGYRVTLVEQDAAAVRTLERNARDLELWRDVRIVRGDAGKLLGKLEPSQIVFSDPPYAQDIPALTTQILEAGLVLPGGLLVAQHDRHTPMPEIAGYTLETRRMGSNALSLYTREGGIPAVSPATLGSE